MAALATRALTHSARTVQVLGGEPTIHLPSVLELVSALPGDAHLVYKTNGHASPAARQLLSGLFDTWVIDYKFGSDACAFRLAQVDRYQAVVRENLRWAGEESNLIVRHLLMPGHLHCCWEPVAAWLAENMPGVKVSLRTGFWPGWRSHKFPELLTHLTPEQEREAVGIAQNFDLHLVPSNPVAPQTQVPQAQNGSGELLILPDGRVLAHNTSPAIGRMLRILIDEESKLKQECHELPN